MRTAPASGSNRRTASEAMVDLPAPLRPNTPVRTPFSKATSKPRRASRSSYPKRTPSNTSRSGFSGAGRAWAGLLIITGSSKISRMRSPQAEPLAILVELRDAERIGFRTPRTYETNTKSSPRVSSPA